MLGVAAAGALAVERRYAPDGTASEWYHHRDHLGSLRIVTDEAGRKAEAHDWYPYGQEMASWTATGATTRKLFTGHERDAETGLDYMLARYYASPSGAFLTVDPLDSSAKAEDPLSWNRYAYVRGNPLNRVDPTGEDPAESGEPKATPVQEDAPTGSAAALTAKHTKTLQKIAELLKNLQRRVSCLVMNHNAVGGGEQGAYGMNDLSGVGIHTEGWSTVRAESDQGEKHAQFNPKAKDRRLAFFSRDLIVFEIYTHDDDSYECSMGETQDRGVAAKMGPDVPVLCASRKGVYYVFGDGTHGQLFGPDWILSKTALAKTPVGCTDMPLEDGGFQIK